MFYDTRYGKERVKPIDLQGCDNYRKLPKSTENLPKTKLPKTNPNPNSKPYIVSITGFSVIFR